MCPHGGPQTPSTQGPEANQNPVESPRSEGGPRIWRRTPDLCDTNLVATGARGRHQSGGEVSCRAGILLQDASRERRGRGGGDPEPEGAMAYDPPEQSATLRKEEETPRYPPGRGAVGEPSHASGPQLLEG